MKNMAKLDFFYYYFIERFEFDFEVKKAGERFNSFFFDFSAFANFFRVLNGRKVIFFLNRSLGKVVSKILVGQPFL